MRSSFAGTMDPTIPDTKYVEYGSNFESVGRIFGKSANGSLFEASAVAIDSHHILTAAHVIHDCTSCYFVANDKDVCVHKFVYSDKYDSGFGVGDIAIGFTKDDLGLQSYPELYDGVDEDKKLCSIVGFGMTGTFETGPNKSDKKRRGGLNRIDYIESELLVCSPSKDHTKTRLEFLIASGDSGGGLFIENKLAGINSCIFVSKGTPNSKYGCESGHTRVSQYIKWIKKTLSENK